MAKKAKSKNEFPKVLYVYADYSDGYPIYIESETLKESADASGPRLVATYQLVAVQTVELETKVTDAQSVVE